MENINISGLEEKLSGLSPEVAEEILKNAESAAEEAKKKAEEEKKFPVTGEWKSEYSEDKLTTEVSIKISEDSDKIEVNLTKTELDKAEGQGMQLDKREFEELAKLFSEVNDQLNPSKTEEVEDSDEYHLPDPFRRWVDWCNRPYGFKTIYFDSTPRFVNSIFRRLGR